MEPVKAAKMCLERPDSYMAAPDEDLETWGRIGMGYNRDSTPMQKAIANAIYDELHESHPDDVCWQGASHWAVGWVEDIKVRILREPGEITEDNLTDVFMKALELSEADSCVYEDAITAAEHEQQIENIAQFIGSGWTSVPDSLTTNEAAERVHAWLFENEYYPGGDDNCWYSDDEIQFACHYLGYIDPDPLWQEDWLEWLDEDRADEFHKVVRYFETVEKEKTQGRLL